MSYQRVLPRDLFNEAKLLKCLGQLALLINDGKLPKLTISHDGDAFFISQQASNGALYCDNVIVMYDGDFHSYELDFTTKYNSKDPYPMILETRKTEIEVFNDDGTLTQEFLNEVS